MNILYFFAKHIILRVNIKKTVFSVEIGTMKQKLQQKTNTFSRVCMLISLKYIYM